MILLFSLLATLVYQYEFLIPGHTPEQLPSRAHIDLLSACGTEVPIEDALYDFEYFSAGGREDIAGIRPPVAPATYTRDSGLVTFRGLMTWDPEGIFFGPWSITVFPFGDDSDHTLYPDVLQSFWPGRYFPESTIGYGGWQFSGIKNVPEAGSTLLYLALGMIALIWRKP